MSVSSRKINKSIFMIAGLLVFGLVFFVFRSNQTVNVGLLNGKTALVYRSSTCGCCANYIAYLRRAGVQVEEKLTEDMTAIKKQFGVPSGLTSCHTTRIDGYTVEGHIPVEAIQKLLVEQLSVAGIAMAGMPSGSPGMPGAKYGTFDISSFLANGSSSPFISL